MIYVPSASKVSKIKTLSEFLKLTGSATIQSTASKAVYYTVKKGDTVWDLSRHYGTSMAQIKSWNKLNYNYEIYPGQKLWV